MVTLKAVSVATGAAVWADDNTVVLNFAQIFGVVTQKSTLLVSNKTQDRAYFFNVHDLGPAGDFEETVPFKVSPGNTALLDVQAPPFSKSGGATAMTIGDFRDLPAADAPDVAEAPGTFETGAKRFWATVTGTLWGVAFFGALALGGYIVFKVVTRPQPVPTPPPAPAVAPLPIAPQAAPQAPLPPPPAPEPTATEAARALLRKTAAAAKKAAAAAKKVGGDE